MSLRKLGAVRAIIGLAFAAVLLAACSTARIAYNQAPSLAYWWIDGYVDISTEQAPKVRESIDQFLDWHRRSELPLYAKLLARAQSQVMEPALAPQAMCAWRDEAQRRLDAALDQAAPAAAALLLTMTPEQLRFLERKLAKNGEDLRNDFAQPDRAERAKAAFKRTLERYENLYGKLDDAQRARLAQLLAASPFDADRWLAERERRNRDLMNTLQAVSTSSRTLDAAAAQVQAQGAVRLLAERALHSPRAEYRAYAERLSQDNCALASAMHNIATPEQRQFARDKLKGWEEDARVLAKGGNGGNGSR
jgi:hypothetical protein